jgi:hypothetical protein
MDPSEALDAFCKKFEDKGNTDKIIVGLGKMYNLL